jgi:hypothetical protein
VVICLSNIETPTTPHFTQFKTTLGTWAHAIVVGNEVGETLLHESQWNLQGACQGNHTVWLIGNHEKRL